MKKAEFLRKIKREFPELKWKKSRHLTHGWDHDIIILDESLVFRAPKETPRSLLSKIYNEIQLLNFLKNKVRVGIPNFSYLSKDKSLAGYKLLEGRELSSNMFKRLSASEKNKFAKQMANFLTTLHKFPKSNLKKFHVRSERAKKNYKWLVKNTIKYVFPRLNKNELQLTKKYLTELKTALGFKYTSALLHNDLTWEHILWDAKKKQANIIDFSDRALGDPASDFAGLWEYGANLVKKVYSLYRGKKDDKLLYRSQLYFKRIPLFVMKDALTGYPCTFKEGYRMFKQRFI